MPTIASSEKPSFPMTWEEAVLWLRQQPEQQELVTACFFDESVLAAAMRYHVSPEWLALKELLPKPTEHTRSVLDVGAGRGISSYAFAVDGWDVTALEPDPSPVVGAQAIREIVFQSQVAIKVVEEGGEHIPFPDASFDIVHARQVLHHVYDLSVFFKEIARVLKPGGLFIATREHVLDSADDLPEFLATHSMHALFGGENAYTLEQYLNALVEAPLLVKNVIGPYSSVINYFPQQEMTIHNWLSAQWPWRAQADERVLQRWGNKTLLASNYLYSFVAVSPLHADSPDFCGTLASQTTVLAALQEAQTRYSIKLKQQASLQAASFRATIEGLQKALEQHENQLQQHEKQLEMHDAAIKKTVTHRVVKQLKKLNPF